VFSPNANVFAYYNKMGVILAPLDQSGYTLIESAENFHTLSLSPDGTWLFVASNGKSFLFNTVDHSRQELELKLADGIDAVWSPDGRQVLLVSLNTILEQKNAWHYQELNLLNLSDGNMEALGAIHAPDAHPYFLEHVEWLDD
jgi:hypothetical protein